MVAHVSEGLINYWRESVYQPIPLTEEWLLKFGFDNNGVVWIGLNTDAQELQITKQGDVLIYDEDDNFIPLNRIQYVHQLQNLFYALTGNELELKQ